ncbi:LysM peptidoglycan-binding domain-containing protein [Ferrimonas sediminicola]|uniref:LysM peptidoglycan-binding domain-containing protein n=1 Tax=Ferrimonas sediminicola TaxID=2569538 RepID=A0A4U1BF41_9GAMM|nr:LysM peptidoglycan-binding domain-containing protein [Ferrimonas sediminicola]
MVLLLGGCSFQSHTPAPVETLYTGKTFKDKPRGSVTQSRYRVQPGDTLYSIAWASGTDYRDLARINRLPSPYTIQVGQWLDLRSVKKSAATASPATKPAKTSTNTSRSTSAAVRSSKQKENTKPVDPKISQEYASTRSSQNINRPLKPALPRKVSKWRWPASGKVVARYSDSAQGQKGLDIVSREGTPVVASAEGRVVYAGSALRGYGKLIIIKHSDDYLSAYAHNRKILVKEKQVVKSGQQIAEMGSTDSDRVMLHFEIRYRGKSVDPERYLPKK